MVLACVVRGCTNKTGNAEQGVSYHIFPKDEIRRKQWTNALALYNWTPDKKSVVCSKHFLDTNFINDVSRNRKLLHSAVPCVFPTSDFDMRRDETQLRELENALHSLNQKADYVNGLMAERTNLEYLIRAPAAQYANHVNALMAERKILHSETKPPGNQSTHHVNGAKPKRKKVKSKVTEVPIALCANHVKVKPSPLKPSIKNQGLIHSSPNLVPASLIDPPSYRLLYSVTGNHINYQTRTPSPWSRAGTYENRGYNLNVGRMPRRSTCLFPQPTYIYRQLNPMLSPAAQINLSDPRAVIIDKAPHADSPDTKPVSFGKTLSSPKSEDPKIINNGAAQADPPESQPIPYEKTLSSTKSGDPKTIIADVMKTITFVPSSHNTEDTKTIMSDNDAMQADLSDSIEMEFSFEITLFPHNSNYWKTNNNNAPLANTHIPQAAPYEKILPIYNNDDPRTIFNDATKTRVHQTVSYEKIQYSPKAEYLKSIFNDATQTIGTFVPQVVPYDRRPSSPNSEITKTVRSDADDDSPRKILLKQEISSLKEKNQLLEKIVELLEICKRLDKKLIAYLKETIRIDRAEKETFIPEDDIDFCTSPELPENDYFYLGL